MTGRGGCRAPRPDRPAGWPSPGPFPRRPCRGGRPGGAAADPVPRLRPRRRRHRPRRNVPAPDAPSSPAGRSATAGSTSAGSSVTKASRRGSSSPAISTGPRSSGTYPRPRRGRPLPRAALRPPPALLPVGRPRKDAREPRGVPRRHRGELPRDGALRHRPAKGHLFIPPYEWYNREIAAWSRELGPPLFHFTPGTSPNADYTTPSMPEYLPTETIYDRILEYEKKDPAGLNGFILLIHIGTILVVDGQVHLRLGELIRDLRARGYTLVRIDELLRKTHSRRFLPDSWTSLQFPSSSIPSSPLLPKEPNVTGTPLPDDSVSPAPPRPPPGYTCSDFTWIWLRVPMFLIFWSG